MKKGFDQVRHDDQRQPQHVEDAERYEGLFGREMLVIDESESRKAQDAHENRGRIVHEIQDGGAVI